MGGKATNSGPLGAKGTGENGADSNPKRGRFSPKLFTDTLSEVIYTFNPDLTIAYMSAQSAHYGYAPKESIGRSIMDFLHPLDKARIRNRFKTPMKPGEERNTSVRIRKKGGGYTWAEVITRPVMKEGNLSYYIGSIRDITEWKQLEFELKRERDLAQSYLDTAEVMMLALDSRGNVSLINRKGCSILGCKKNGIIGKNWFDNFIPKGIVAEMKGVFRDIMDGKAEQKTNYENVVLTGGGRERLIEWHNTTLRGQSGEILGTLSSGLDITEKRKAENELIATRNQLSAILSSMSEGVNVLDRDGNVVYVNEAAAKRAGYGSPKEMAGIQLPEHILSKFVILDESGKSITKDTFTSRRVLKSRKHEITTACYKNRSSGEERWAVLSSTPILDEKGEVRFVVTLTHDITERKMVEKKLRESEEKYRSLFEHMKEGLAYCKMLFDKNNRPADFIYLDVNDSFGRITGLKGVLGKRASVAIPGIKETHPELFEIYGRVALTGKAEKFEIDFKPLEMWLSVSAYSPEKGYFVAVFDDISDRKEAEEALKSSEEKFRSTLDSMDDLIIKFDNKGTILGHHNAGGRAPLLDTKSFVNKNYRKVLPPELAVPLKSALERANATGETQHFEHSLHTGGRVGWFSVKLSACLGSNGEISGFTAVSRDITVSKRAEENLALSERKYRQLVDSLNEGIWVTDKDSYTTFVNPRMAEMLGYTVQEMVGEHFLSFMREDKMQLSKEILLRRKKGLAEHYDFEFMKKDGKPLYARIGARPILDNDGNYEGSLVAVTDITETMKTEKALRQNEAMFMSTICSKCDALMVIDKDGIVSGYHTPSGRNPLIPPEKILGNDFESVFDPYQRNSRPNALKFLASAIKRMKAGGDAEQLKYAVKQDGVSLKIRAIIYPNRGPQGAYNGVTVTIRDETEKAKKKK